MNNFNQNIPSYLSNLLRSEGALRATLAARNAVDAVTTNNANSVGGGQTTTPPNDSTPAPASTPTPTPAPRPSSDEKKLDRSWIWKLAIPIGLMIGGPIVGLFLGTVGMFMAVPIWSYSFGCVVCGVLFVPGVIWLRVVKWLEERQDKKGGRKFKRAV